MNYPASLAEIESGSTWRYFPVDENADVWAPRTEDECKELLLTHPKGSTFLDGEPMTGVIGYLRQRVTYGHFEHPPKQRDN